MRVLFSDMAASGIKHGVESVIGRRKTMEDRHVAVDSLNANYPELFESIPQACSFYAVYDGHGGVEAAVMCEQLLHTSIVEDPEFASGNVETAIRNGFRQTDSKILQDSVDKQWQAGSTAVMALVVGQTLHVANLGDSEMLVAKRSAGKLEPLVVSVKHKPTDDAEKDRIKNAGGMVVRGRIFGMLAVSRSFGDRDYKHPFNDVEEHFVSNVPHVASMDLGHEHLFMVLSCDGLWDKMTYEDVVASVAASRDKGLSPTDAAKVLVQAASDRGSLDNISAIVVYLPPAAASEPPSLRSSKTSTPSSPARNGSRPTSSLMTYSEDELAERILQEAQSPPPQRSAAAESPAAGRAKPTMRSVSAWNGTLNVAQLKERFPGLSVDLLQVMLDVDLRVIHVLLEHVPSPEFDKTSSAALTVFDSIGAVFELLQSVVNAEVQATTEPNTLFRASTAGCKLVSDYSSLVGWEFLKKTLAKPLEKIRGSKSTFEVRSALLAHSGQLVVPGQLSPMPTNARGYSTR
eukprot:TRINITY_DN3337_c0_g1_i1.p1 TRINITY_DN3337_c0_g1~~TRINITY_DN3337_c0_g1_i1.p1  ORF type:complete len:517 (-),score=136.78 TRINITY_DN3337_c0_g1_i1:11-1561(-)